jgi:hypothetical protein
MAKRCTAIKSNQGWDRFAGQLDPRCSKNAKAYSRFCAHHSYFDKWGVRFIWAHSWSKQSPGPGGPFVLEAIGSPHPTKKGTTNHMTSPVDINPHVGEQVRILYRTPDDNVLGLTSGTLDIVIDDDLKVSAINLTRGKGAGFIIPRDDLLAIRRLG